MAGNLDIQNKSRFEQRKEVSHMAIHPNYTGTNNNFKNDVCILRLLTPLRMNSMINKITVEKSESQPGTQCLISGWGSKHVNMLYTSYISLSLNNISADIKNKDLFTSMVMILLQESGSVVNKLQFADVEILESETCRMSYNDITGRKLFYSENMVCAGIDQV